MLLRPNYRGFIRGSVTLPFKVAGVIRELVENLGESSAVDLATGLAAALPPGVYRGTGIERYVDEVLSDPDRTERLPPPLIRALSDRHRPRHHRASDPGRG